MLVGVFVNKEGEPADQWCHARRPCIVQARLLGYVVYVVTEGGYVIPTREDQWHNQVSKCVFCEQYINWVDRVDDVDGVV